MLSSSPSFSWQFISFLIHRRDLSFPPFLFRAQDLTFTKNPSIIDYWKKSWSKPEGRLKNSPIRCANRSKIVNHSWLACVHEHGEHAASGDELFRQAFTSRAEASEEPSNTVVTRSSATAEKQRVSCACLPRLANWSCNAQNTAVSQRLYYFWHSNALIQEVLARKRILSWNSHWRSFKAIHFAIICRSTRGSICLLYTSPSPRD